MWPALYQSTRPHPALFTALRWDCVPAIGYCFLQDLYFSTTHTPLCMARRHRQTLQTALTELHAWREAHSSPCAFVLSFADLGWTYTLHFVPWYRNSQKFFVPCEIRSSDPLLARLACKPLGYTEYVEQVVAVLETDPKKSIIWSCRIIGASVVKILSQIVYSLLAGQSVPD